MINQLYDAMKAGKGREVIDDILKELARYTDYHFKTEEKYMEKYKYPDVEAHKKQHRDFVNKVNDFIDKKAKGQVTLTIEVMNFLKDWLAGHILGTDKKMGEFLQKFMG